MSDVICDALRRSAAILPVAALVTYTASGTTALRAARERPPAPILSLTPDLPPRAGSPWSGACTRCMYKSSAACPRSWTTPSRSLREGFAKPGDKITITAGMPFGSPAGPTCCGWRRCRKARRAHDLDRVRSTGTETGSLGWGPTEKETSDDHYCRRERTGSH